MIAVALSLDASGVTMGIGCGANPRYSEKFLVILSFGFFQFLFALLGGLFGNYIDQNFFQISDLFSGLIILILGFLLLKEGYKQEEECIYRRLNLLTIIILGISVSIDALGVGFSVLYTTPFPIMLKYSLIIGIITTFLTLLSFMIIKYIKNIGIIEKYADYMGGIILVLLGLNMIL